MIQHQPPQGAGDRLLGVAVIGLGTIARITHLPILRDRDDVEIVAVCDRPEILTAHPYAPGFTDVESMLDQVTPDAAYVLTPAISHGSIVRALLHRRIPTFCEKPLASTAGEARALADLAEAAEVPFLVGYNRRFAPVYQRAKDLLVHRPATLATFQKTRRERFYRASLDNLIHMVDLARFYFGEPDEVTAVAAFDDPFWEENLSATLRFPGGQIVNVIGNRSSGIWSERVDLYGGGQTITVNAPGEIVIATDDIERVERRSPAASGYDDPVDALGFTAQTEHFLAAVQGRGRITENSAASALATQELMERILATAGLPVADHHDGAVHDLPRRHEATVLRQDQAERGAG